MLITPDPHEDHADLHVPLADRPGEPSVHLDSIESCQFREHGRGQESLRHHHQILGVLRWQRMQANV